MSRLPGPRPNSGLGRTRKLRLTILFDEPDDEGWIVARVHQVPGAVSQGRTRDEARENVINALRLMLTPEETNADGSEPLKLLLQTQ